MNNFTDTINALVEDEVRRRLQEPASKNIDYKFMKRQIAGLKYDNEALKKENEILKVKRKQLVQNTGKEVLGQLIENLKDKYKKHYNDINSINYKDPISIETNVNSIDYDDLQLDIDFLQIANFQNGLKSIYFKSRLKEGDKIVLTDGQEATITKVGIKTVKLSSVNPKLKQTVVERISKVYTFEDKTSDLKDMTPRYNDSFKKSYSEYLFNIWR